MGVDSGLAGWHAVVGVVHLWLIVREGRAVARLPVIPSRCVAAWGTTTCGRRGQSIPRPRHVGVRQLPARVEQRCVKDGHCEESGSCRSRRRRAERAVPLSCRVLQLLVQKGGRAPRAHRRGAVCGRVGDVAGRADTHGRASARARRDIRRRQPWMAGTAASAGLHAVAACRRREDRVRRRRQQLVASRRPDQPGPVVLPRLRPRPQRRSVHPGLALLLRRRAGDREDIMDRVLDAIRLGPADDTTNWLAWPNETTSKPGRHGTPAAAVCDRELRSKVQPPRSTEHRG